MSLEINNKRFMNLQEAVAWLLANNALPFQSTANYAPNTEIAKTTIINPSPAEIKVGALVLFADSKVGTVSGITTNGFMVGSDYTDIKNALAYIVSVALNGSNHLITTLSDGTTQDAGLIKEVASMSINASQHLIVTYNDGSTNDLGAIFSGNINISGNLTASGTITGSVVTGNSIVEIMNGYRAEVRTNTGWTVEKVYIGACKTGNKLTVVVALNLTRGTGAANNPTLINFIVPEEVGQNLYPSSITGTLDSKNVAAYKDYLNHVGIDTFVTKASNSLFRIAIENGNALELATPYYFRYEATFLLGPTL